LKFTDKKAICFDLDGTLIDSVPDLALAVNEMLTVLGRETFEEDTVRFWVGNGAQTLVKRALLGKRDVDETVDEAYFTKALEIFLSFYEKRLCTATVPYPHVLETLQALKEKGYTLTIVTNKPVEFVQPILKELGFEGCIEYYLGGNSLERKKPDPLPLQHLCRELDIDIDECVMVGDSKNDILAANACGMQSIGVTYGYNYGEDISVYKPDVIVDDFAEIMKFL
jgi:phosphoglycolate phosphatase